MSYYEIPWMKKHRLDEEFVQCFIGMKARNDATLSFIDRECGDNDGVATIGEALGCEERIANSFCTQSESADKYICKGREMEAFERCRDAYANVRYNRHRTLEMFGIMGGLVVSAGSVWVPIVMGGTAASIVIGVGIALLGLSPLGYSIYRHMTED